MKYNNQILNKRETTHGDYVTVSTLAQKLKANIRHHVLSELTKDQRESLDMICSKIGRICSGNPNEVDHWRDIAGYAELVVTRLEKGTYKHVVEQSKREPICATDSRITGDSIDRRISRLDPTAPGYIVSNQYKVSMKSSGLGSLYTSDRETAERIAKENNTTVENISEHPTPPLPYADKSHGRDERVRL